MGKLKLTLSLASFRDKSKIWLIFKMATITFATLTLFSKDLTILFSDALQSEVTSHILAVPFIFAYMLYRKRKTLRAVLPLKDTGQSTRLTNLAQATSILLITASILLYWYGSYTFTPLEHHLLVLPIFAAGLVLLLFNTQTLRQASFPIIFLLFLVPPPSEILFTIGSLLSNLSALVSSTIASTIGIPSTLISEYGNPLIQITGSDGFPINFSVDIACSGIYSLISFLMFATLVAYMIRDRTWKKIALILTGIPIIYLFNVLRLIIILIIGYHYGETLALEIFHLLGGWTLIFIATLLLLFLSEKIFKTKMFTRTEKCPQCSSTGTIKPQTNQSFCSECSRILKPAPARILKTDLIKIAAVIITVISLVAIQAPMFALTEKPAVVLVTTSSGQQVSTEILPDIPEYELRFNYRDTEFEELYKVDLAISYVYAPQDTSLKPIWVSVEIGSAKSLLHRWETCLINYPLQQGWTPKITQIELRDIQLSENPPLMSRYFTFRYTKTNALQAVLYWYESASFNVNSTMQQKHVKISLIAYPWTTEDFPQIENQISAIAKPIVDYWQPIIIWSPVAITLSQSGSTLTGTTSILLIAILILYVIETRRQRKLNKTAYTKLSQTTQQLITVVQKSERTTNSTLDNIANIYYETTGQAIDKASLLQKLAEIEKIGLIRRSIKNQQDEPILTWKT